ncbi:hypothetical protein [Sphingosinicella sp.]|uniref:S10 family serine carboxypeptidase-like protein n=1 Tax=Sphingosinicella sp. TaxID=1917971 RepID=UPI0035ADE236
MFRKVVNNRIGSPLAAAVCGLAMLASLSSHAEDRVAAPQLTPVPRSGSVDVPLMMSGIPPLPPMTMSAREGARKFVSTETGTFNGVKVRYRIELAETIIETSGGEPAASLFTTSYVAQGKNSAARPVVFVFNGGPGGSSAPLHMTALGPKRLSSLKLEDLANPDSPLIANPETVLDVADLVFIDPVDTGFSRAMPGKAERFRTVDSDSEALTQFVLQWLKAHGRMNAPKYILGESYGSLRAIAMARDLARSSEKVVIDGIVLVGSAYTFGSNGRTPEPLMVASKLPMMASVAWHYGKIDNRTQSWEQAVDKARAFVRDTYAGALMQGHRLDPETREKVIRALPGLIGIPETYFRQNNRISVANFNGELLRQEGRVLDRNNGLETRPAEPGTPVGELDYDKIVSGYAAVTSAMEKLAARLGAKDLGRYVMLDRAAMNPGYWSMQIAGDPALDVTLAKLLNTHAKMQLLVLQGRYDTLTDMGTVEYTLGQTDLAPQRYRIAHYDGGHALAPEKEAMEPLRALLKGAR